MEPSVLSAVLNHVARAIISNPMGLFVSHNELGETTPVGEATPWPVEVVRPTPKEDLPLMTRRKQQLEKSVGPLEAVTPSAIRVYGLPLRAPHGVCTGGV